MLSQAHIHLLINHLPIFGSLLGALVLIHGLWTKSYQTKVAAYNLFIISALGAGIAYITGEAAEETIENIQGINESVIEMHEYVASFALATVGLLGLLSIYGAYLVYKSSAVAKTMAYLILLTSLMSFILLARTGYLGGKIRHTEIYNTAIEPNVKGEENHDND